MNVRLLFFAFNLVMIPILAMEKEQPVKKLYYRPYSSPSKISRFKALMQRMPDLKKHFDAKITRKGNETFKTNAGIAYSGPKVWDTICSSIFLNNDQFAIADEDEAATDIYYASAPFIKADHVPFGKTAWVMNALASNNSQLAITANRNIVLWDLQTHQQVGVLKGHIDLIESIDFNPNDPTQLVSGSSDTTIKIWDTRTDTCSQSLTDDEKVCSVNFCPVANGQLASVNNAAAEALALWDLANGKKLALANASMRAQYNHSGNTIITSIPGKLLLYNAATLQVEQALDLPNNWSQNNAEVTSFDFTIDDKNVVVSGQLSDIFICDGQIAQIEQSFDSGMLGVDVHYSPDNTKILSSTYGCPIDTGTSVRIWNVEEIKKKIGNLESKDQPWISWKQGDSYKCALQ